MESIAEGKQRSGAQQKVSRFLNDYAIFIAMLLLIVVFSIASPYFFTYSNIRNMLQQTAPLAIVAIGQALIVFTGQFDLSLGQNVCLTGFVATWLMKYGGVNPWLSLLAAVAVGALIGLSSGVLIAYARIPCFIVTLGFQMICRGLARIISNAAPITTLPEEIHFFGGGFIGGVERGIPISVVIVLGLYVLFMFIMRKTEFGRSVYALGGSEEASYFSGIDVRRVRMLVFTIAGTLCALGSIVLFTKLDSAALTNGNLYEFDCMIACILGGISLAGGRGKIIQAFLGVLFLTVFFNGMTMLNVHSYVQDVLKGAVLVGAVAIDVIRNKR